MEREKYKVTITKLDHQGRGICYIKNRITFVEDALPNEEVMVYLTEEKKKYAVGRVDSYITKSKDRVEAICPYYRKCGGCDLMHLSYDKQLIFKEEKVKEIMGRYAHLDTSLVKPILFSDNITFYRNKATFKVENKIGFYGKKSNQLISVSSCKIVNQKINKLVQKISKEFSLKEIYELVIRVSSLGESMVIIKTNMVLDEEKIISSLKEEVSTIILCQNKSNKVLYGNGSIVDQIGAFSYQISPSSFFQVHTTNVKILYDQIVTSAQLKEEDTVLDLYAGTGTIGIYTSPFVKKVIGIEINAGAVEDAKKNAKMNGCKNISFICEDISRLEENYHPDVIIVDPPRSGLDERALQFIQKENPQKLIYVSCDPVTLARDLNILKEVYDVKEITPVDMFPQTYHVECVSLLVRKTPEK